MGDSLQSYFSNLLGCAGTNTEIVSDNARSRSSLNFHHSDTNLDWLTDCCSVDTTWSGGSGGVCFNRWDTNESISAAGKNQDTAVKPYARRRPLGEGSESGHMDDEATDEDILAIFLPTEKAMDEPCCKGIEPHRLPMRNHGVPTRAG
jgi:hypothetical protein